MRKPGSSGPADDTLSIPSIGASSADLPLPLPGFENIRRYRDPASGTVIAKLLPGEFYVTRTDELLDTVLGSCVSACIRHPHNNVGGMNHFMLPYPKDQIDSWGAAVGLAARYGSASMEQLINTLLQDGGTRGELEVKIFGGAQVLSALTQIGNRNLKFVREYLEREGMKITAADIGDTCPRHIRYHALSGHVRLKRLGRSRTASVASREQQYLTGLDGKPLAGPIDLF